MGEICYWPMAFAEPVFQATMRLARRPDELFVPYLVAWLIKVVAQ